MIEFDEIYLLTRENEAEELEDVEPAQIFLEEESDTYRQFEYAIDSWIDYDSLQNGAKEESRAADINYSPDLENQAIESIKHFTKIHEKREEELNL